MAMSMSFVFRMFMVNINNKMKTLQSRQVPWLAYYFLRALSSPGGPGGPIGPVSPWIPNKLCLFVPCTRPTSQRPHANIFKYLKNREGLRMSSSVVWWNEKEHFTIKGNIPARLLGSKGRNDCLFTPPLGAIWNTNNHNVNACACLSFLVHVIRMLIKYWPHNIMPELWTEKNPKTMFNSTDFGRFPVVDCTFVSSLFSF